MIYDYLLLLLILRFHLLQPHLLVQFWPIIHVLGHWTETPVSCQDGSSPAVSYSIISFPPPFPFLFFRSICSTESAEPTCISLPTWWDSSWPETVYLGHPTPFLSCPDLSWLVDMIMIHLPWPEQPTSYIYIMHHIAAHAVHLEASHSAGNDELDCVELAIFVTESGGNISMCGLGEQTAGLPCGCNGDDAFAETDCVQIRSSLILSDPPCHRRSCRNL